MGKIKIKRASTKVDMTAMCDVSFLLLTFFILTATARQPEPLPVDMPASTVQIKVPDTNLGTVTVGGGGKVFFGVTGPNIRINMLNRVSEKYGITFTDEEKQRFSLIDGFGVPISRLKDLIAMDNTQRIAKGVQPGIPADSTDNQLKEWIYAARMATAEVNDEQMRIAIKGDADEDYPAIKKVIDILQEQSLNKFSLITNLRVAD
ncbi:biopolymer transporter ExbD [Albibacterium sp.]|uniref:biopolymer transporter ExbD n=1 Tax=Albibacterium sp. TaxID=2952885 RepID=UPI002CDEBFB9|nr:biopolymer transporter ExbD [Albibacterium sp.]HUH19762.1 biopolymer transporter ExbD [Albibacterium sp.]